MEIRTVAVIGLGLIGGSLARDLAALGMRVLGHDRDPATVDAALADGGIHAALDPQLRDLAEAEVTIVAVPVASVSHLLGKLRPRLGTAGLVMDVGSTKRGVIAAAEEAGIGSRFVGAHPLAGDHRSGWSASRLGLFKASRVFLCPTTSTSAGTLQLAQQFWQMLGTRPEIVSAHDHDRLLAWTSHLPQITATAVARALAGMGIPRKELGSGGRDTTRLAGSSPEMWTGIALENADVVALSLRALEWELARMRTALEQRDAGAVDAFFRAGRDWFGQEPV